MNIDWSEFRNLAKEVLRTLRNTEDVSVSEPKPEPKRINVCEEIKCPYAYRTSLKASSGCNRYPTAHQCHLVRTYPDLRKEATAYFLHSDADLVSISGLKRENDSFFLDNPKNRESLEFQVEMGEGTLYAPFGEETFDLAAYLNQ